MMTPMPSHPPPAFGPFEVRWGDVGSRPGAWIGIRARGPLRRHLIVPVGIFWNAIGISLEDGLPVVLDLGFPMDARDYSKFLNLLFEGPYGPDEGWGPRPRLIDLLSPVQTMELLRTLDGVIQRMGPPLVMQTVPPEPASSKA
jgi:hypothetical protein